MFVSFFTTYLFFDTSSLSQIKYRDNMLKESVHSLLDVTNHDTYVVTHKAQKFPKWKSIYEELTVVECGIPSWFNWVVGVEVAKLCYLNYMPKTGYHIYFEIDMLFTCSPMPIFQQAITNDADMSFTFRGIFETVNTGLVLIKNNNNTRNFLAYMIDKLLLQKDIKGGDNQLLMHKLGIKRSLFWNNYNKYFTFTENSISIYPSSIYPYILESLYKLSFQAKRSEISKAYDDSKYCIIHYNGENEKKLMMATINHKLYTATI